MLNFKRKRVLNPNLIVKFVVLSMLVGALTMVASLPVDASFAGLFDEISENDPPNEEQISLEEELAILTGRDNHSKYLPNDSEEEEEDYYDPSERSMMSEYILQVDIPPTEEFTRANKICKAYDDAMLIAEDCKDSMDLAASFPPKTATDYRGLISAISFFSAYPLNTEIKDYREKGHSEDEQNVFSATLRSNVQDHVFAKFEKAQCDVGHKIYKNVPIVLWEIPSDGGMPRFEAELLENERNEQSDNQNNRQHNEQSNKHQTKHGDICPCLLI